ncbi:MAG: diguanylate cyclase [Planctomycetes bacterium]|nr:diguanylate cyclase [Planctomycetota bacterium]
MKSLRSFLIHAFGLDREMEELRREVVRLGWDASYGVYTRPGLERLAALQPRGDRIIVFLDFDDVHRMNDLLGYVEVNRRIRRILDTPMRRGDLVGRWFSGDEIVIVFESYRAGALNLMRRLEAVASEEGMSFTWSPTAWCKEMEPLARAVDRTVPFVMARKAARKARGEEVVETPCLQVLEEGELP